MRCGKCEQLHDTVADVKRCYGLQTSQEPDAPPVNVDDVFASISELLKEGVPRAAASRLAAYSVSAGLPLANALDQFADNCGSRLDGVTRSKLEEALERLIEDEQWERRKSVMDDLRKMQLGWSS